ncbi:hypothetical protein GYMLUDRAFT_88462 [Collybiopsis luxurians FD-317 M1]|uniref:Uncharacterized protein n=1 Tax=Collybiopsis luxurians FD-317 M1 TaxID=944289 RepID=A0A0D0BEU1_9AGAR|nr:hypothetical protein GYMLUDRAFT_88462 [Collybiopsis luxurians FD-317 M1]
MPAFTLDDIPALCSPPSTSPKEIFGWIQSDSVLLWNDGYSVAREDSRLFISTAFQDPICCPPDAKAGTGSTNTRSNAKAKTTSTLANEAVKSRNSLFSSSTLNRTSRKKQLGSASLCFSAGPRSISSSTTICSSPSPRPQPLTQSQMNGATLVPSMRDLSDDLGPLEQGTRWGLNWYTLEKPVSISRLKVEGMNGRGKDKRKENSSLRVKLGKENLGV